MQILGCMTLSPFSVSALELWFLLRVCQIVLLHEFEHPGSFLCLRAVWNSPDIRGCCLVFSISTGPLVLGMDVFDLSGYIYEFLRSIIRLSQILFQVSRMWCSKRTIFSKLRAFLIFALSSIVWLLTELEKLKPIKRVVPSLVGE